MQMEVFAEMVRTAVAKELGQGFSVRVQEVIKNNGVCLKGLMVKRRDRNMEPTIYLETFLEAYENGVPFPQVIHKILQVYQANQGGSVDLEFFRNFGEVQDRICYRLVNKKENRVLLDDVPCMEFLDLAVCFYYAYSDDTIGEGSILIHNSHVGMWGTNTVGLARLAHVNTPRLFPARCVTLAEILAEGTHGMPGIGAGGTACIPSDPDYNAVPMKILTNSTKTYGAACILYPGVLEEAAKKMGGDFYIIPSSLHEVILLPYGGGISVREIKGMVSEINDTQVAPEEVLSNSLYYYSTRAKEVRLV